MITARRPLTRTLALLASLSLLAGACGDDADEGASGGATDDTGTATTEAEASGALEGVRGTFPSAEVTEEFQERLLEIDPELQDYTYGPEIYDAMVISALAAEAAGSDAADAIAREINGVTRDGTECMTFEECKGLIEGDEDIAYVGASGPSEFSQPGERTISGFAIQEFGPDNQLDPELTEYQTAEIEDFETGDADPQCTAEADGVLTFGTVLPETGNLAILGPPEFAGAELAIADINAAGGVLGADAVLEQGDSGDATTDIANQTVDRHLAAGADVIVGAASSGVSFTFIDKVVQSCTIQFSPANTSPDFTTYEEDDLYFRTAPSDILQGRVLADAVVADGNATVAILALQDPYGEGLQRYTLEPLQEQGAEVVVNRVYDPAASNFDAEVDEVVEADPDALVLIGFDESSRILARLFELGFTPDEKNIYLVDGNLSNALGEDF